MPERHAVPRFIKRHLRVAFALCLMLVSGSMAIAHAETREGFVVSVESGDTLVVEDVGHRRLQVRLAWISAPDRLQDHGEAARSSLNAMATGQAVRLENLTESNGRWQANVWAAPADSPCRSNDCRKTLDLGLAQLTLGMAWHDRRISGQAPQALGQYEHAEFEAKIRRIGLWAGKNPVPPWSWRGR